MQTIELSIGDQAINARQLTDELVAAGLPMLAISVLTRRYVDDTWQDAAPYLLIVTSEPLTDEQQQTGLAVIAAHVPTTPPPGPADTELTRLAGLLTTDWSASEDAWATLSSADKATHLRVRTNALRDAVLWLYRYNVARDTSALEDAG